MGPRRAHYAFTSPRPSASFRGVLTSANSLAIPRPSRLPPEHIVWAQAAPGPRSPISGRWASCPSPPLPAAVNRFLWSGPEGLPGSTPRRPVVGGPGSGPGEAAGPQSLARAGPHTLPAPAAFAENWTPLQEARPPVLNLAVSGCGGELAVLPGPGAAVAGQSRRSRWWPVCGKGPVCLPVGSPRAVTAVVLVLKH